MRKTLFLSTATALALLSGCGGTGGDNNVGDSYADIFEYNVDGFEDKNLTITLITPTTTTIDTTTADTTAIDDADTEYDDTDTEYDDADADADDTTDTTTTVATPSANYTILDYPTHGRLTVSGNIATYIPDADWFGDDDFKVAYSVPSDVAYTEYLYHLHIVDTPEENVAPTIKGTPTTEITEGQKYYFKPTIYDENGDALTLSIANAPSWMDFNPKSGELNGTAEKYPEEFNNITITVSDGEEESSLSFDLTVLSKDED